MGKADRFGFAGAAGREHDPANVVVPRGLDRHRRARLAVPQHPGRIREDSPARVLKRRRTARDHRVDAQLLRQPRRSRRDRHDAEPR